MDGMWNSTKGGWNPSRDDFRYDSSNSATGMDFATLGMGLRRWGIGGKPPFLIRGANKGAEVGYRGAKGLYKGGKKIRAWKRSLDSKISKKISKEPYTAVRRGDKLRQKGKSIARILNSKKGRTGIAVGSTTLFGAGTQETTDSWKDSEWILGRKKKKQGAWF